MNVVVGCIVKKEDKFFKTTGKIVEVNNHNINVYVS